MAPRAQVWQRPLFLAFCLSSAVPVWLADLPPMADLPQHAAQIAIWSGWGDSAAGYDGVTYPEIYRINWLAPHLLPHLLVLALSSAAPITLGIQCVLSLAVAGVPAATAWLMRVAGLDRAGVTVRSASDSVDSDSVDSDSVDSDSVDSDSVDSDSGRTEWWALATVPVAYGFSFYWGFFNFLVASPAAILVVALTFRFVEQRGALRGAALALSLNALFLCHLLVFGYAGLVAATVLLAGWFRGPRSAGQAVRLMWPIAAGAPLLIGWLAGNLVAVERSTIPVANYFALDWRRLLELPGLIVGDDGDLAGVALILALVALLFLGGARPSRNSVRWAPLGVALALYLFGPSAMMGTALISPRFSFFVIPGILVALEWRRDSAVRNRRRWALRSMVLVVTLWLVVLGSRFRDYDRELGDLRSILERAPLHQRLLYLTWDFSSESVPQPVFLHLGGWYQVERKGVADFSFSTYFANRFRYRAASRLAVPRLRRFTGSFLLAARWRRCLRSVPGALRGAVRSGVLHPGRRRGRGARTAGAVLSLSESGITRDARLVQPRISASRSRPERLWRSSRSRSARSSRSLSTGQNNQVVAGAATDLESTSERTTAFQGAPKQVGPSARNISATRNSLPEPVG